MIIMSSYTMYVSYIMFNPAFSHFIAQIRERYILFVSHMLSTVTNLCDKAFINDSMLILKSELRNACPSLQG